jgi:hypothetical protein
MDADVFYTIESAKKEKLNLDLVNIMAMDYGNVSNGATGMGGYAISAAEGLRKQLKDIKLSEIDIGITPMIGQNDVQSEIFRVEDAKKLTKWAKGKKWVRLLSYWSMNRDLGKGGDLFLSSQVKQTKYEFLKTMQKFESADVYQREVSTARIFSPYVDITTWPTVDINKVASKAKVKHFTLGFMGSNQWGNPAWGDTVPLEEEFYLDFIKKVRKNGGDIAISFGGIDSTDIALDNDNADTLRDKYEWVIGTYSLERMDFYLTEDSIKNKKANRLRAQAIKRLQKDFPDMVFQISVPISNSGLSKEGLKLFTISKDEGIGYDVINLLAYDIKCCDKSEGASIVKAVKKTIKQLEKLKLDNFQLGITTMIGKNNKKNIVVNNKQAKSILKYAKSNQKVSMLSIWSVNRDTSKSGPLYTSSKIKQKDFEFSKIFKSFK